VAPIFPRGIPDITRSDQLEIWQEFFRKARCGASQNSPLFELAPVLVRFYHVASGIVNANHGIMRAAAVHRVSDCILNRIQSGIPQPTEWQRIGNKIGAAFVFARANLINVRVV